MIAERFEVGGCVFGGDRSCCVFTKASEASWSYSCDSKVSFDRVQILTTVSGRSPPPSPLPTSPLLLLVFLPPSLPPSLLPLRKFDSVLSSLLGMRLVLRILRPHSLTLTVSLSLSLSSLSSLSHLFLISLISLSSLSLSLLSVSRLSVSLLSLLSQEDPGKEPHIKDSSLLPPKRAPCFFLPRCPPLSHSGALAFAPPLGLKFLFFIFLTFCVFVMFRNCRKCFSWFFLRICVKLLKS